MTVNLDVPDLNVTPTNEVFVRFGPDQRLTGILSGVGGNGCTLLLPSAGLQPRAGPFRMHVLLADRLARQGIRCFRYDVPGVGEAPRIAGCDATQASMAAIDQLQLDHGCHTFAIGGICSAADTAWDVAVADSRVSALLLLDGICFAGPWYHYAHILSLLRRMPREWRHFARRLPARMKGRPGLDSNSFRTWPDHATARRQFEQLVARDVRFMWVFSGGYGDRFLHPRQFGWSFGPATRDPRVAFHYWPDCDHTYFVRAQRERLITTTTDWMVNRLNGQP